MVKAEHLMTGNEELVRLPEDGRRQLLLRKYEEDTITEEELKEFVEFLKEDIKYARWHGKDTDALKMLKNGVKAKLLLKMMLG